MPKRIGSRNIILAFTEATLSAHTFLEIRSSRLQPGLSIKLGYVHFGGTNASTNENG